MHILMFGWEFPPRISGGLGTACFGITKGLAGLGHRITFVLPQAEAISPPFLNLVPAYAMPVDAADLGEGEPVPRRRLAVRPIPALLNPYLSKDRYRELALSGRSGFRESAVVYGHDLIAEVTRYGQAACTIARRASFDIIHAHDWMTVPAALCARRISGKPLVLHIHSLEYDRSGDSADGEILKIEQAGLEQADRLIAVSHRTKRMIVERYGIPPQKVSVVYNAVSRNEAQRIYRTERPGKNRIVLFLGRITFQKGPDYFVEAAARVLKVLPDVTFVMAGAGNMMRQMIERVGELKIGDRFHFTGFLQGEEIERIFSLSDLYVMPSVSEPFGISPLEAMLYDVPVILSRQSGVAEILKHALKVDFWDIRELSAKIIAVLKHPALRGVMVEKAKEELLTIRWDTAAERITELYRETVQSGNGRQMSY
jgi:glycosyltransferase involved in cell wall biosynthesis